MMKIIVSVCCLQYPVYSLVSGRLCGAIRQRQRGDDGGGTEKEARLWDPAPVINRAR